MRISILTPRIKDHNQTTLYGVQHRAGQKYNVMQLIKDCIFMASKDFAYYDDLWIEVLVETHEEKINADLREQIHQVLYKFQKEGGWWGYPVLKTVDLIVLV